MKLHFYVLTILLGVVATVHLGMNGKVGVAMNNTQVANAVFWGIGALAAVIIGATGSERSLTVAAPNARC